MSVQQLAEEIENLIVSLTDDFAEGVDSIQGRLYNRLVAVIKDLELDDEGYIKQSAANRRILYDAENLINEYLPGESLPKIVSNAVLGINEIDSANERYFSDVSGKFNPNRNYIKGLQQQTIQKIEQNILQDGLTVQIKTPLVDILNRNVNSGGSFYGFLQEIRNFITGNEDIDGRLFSYSRTYLRDTLFQYHRSYQQSITKDLKLEFYMWAGGTMDKSREFCIEHSGNFYHHREIEKFSKQNWRGKIPGTTESSIFTLAGGYNCTHSIIPVSEVIVPEDVIERNRKVGNI